MEYCIIYFLFHGLVWAISRYYLGGLKEMDKEMTEHPVINYYNLGKWLVIIPIVNIWFLFKLYTAYKAWKSHLYIMKNKKKIADSLREIADKHPGVKEIGALREIADGIENLK